MIIDRCTCSEVTFSALREIARAHDSATTGALQEHVAFGRNCGLCLPYVRRMMRTGETVFHGIITPEDEPPE